MRIFSKGITLLFLLISCGVIAQDMGAIQEPVNNIQGDAISNEGNINRSPFATNRSGVSELNAEGSPFMKVSFTKGAIVVKGEDKNEAFLRYNVHLDHLEIKEGKRVRQLLKREDIAAEIDGKRYLYTSYPDGNKKEKGYLIQLTEGEVKLYYKPTKIFKAAQKAETGYGSNEPARYIDMESYFLQEGNGEKVKIKINKRTLKELFGKEYDNAMDHAKNNDLDKKDPYDLAELIEWYNGISTNG